MEQKKLDAIWLPYEYAYDENGICIALHWRERLVRRDKGWTWRGWVHENLITDRQVKSERVNIPVKHINHSPDQSTERNLQILEKAYNETKDPRYIHYLGITLFSMGRWQESIDILKEYVAVGGWDEEIYRSLLRMSDASLELGRKEDALQYATRAAVLLPDYPDAYFSLAQVEFDDDNWKATTEWLKVAFSKTRPDSASITDPTVPDKARLIGAISEFQQKNYREAVGILKLVKTVDTTDLMPEFERQASIDRVAAILPALTKHYKNPDNLWLDLDDELKFDNRFRKFRESVTEPAIWPKNSIVIFCGKGYEEWGPHTLNRGMGGSEEAVVYLSRELAELGYLVTVFGEVKDPYLDVYKETNAVQWLPWTHIDKRDTFDTLIIWRYPQFVPQFKALKKLVDMHDLLPEKIVRPYPDATYCFKSQFHKDRYPEITNFNVISNGYEKGQFNAKAS
jgi:tetratricopeptide (TPR) repeat protein